MAGLVAGVCSGWVTMWLMIGLAASQAGRLSVAAVIMGLRGTGPVRTIRFLEDARERQVLRQAGAAYQFRHARVQDRLAEEYEAARERSTLDTGESDLEIGDSSDFARRSGSDA
jgi:hypothetical protein